MTFTPEEKAGEIIQKALFAAAEFQQFDQQMTDKIAEAVYKAGLKARISLAKMAFEETGIGVWEHKVWKNVIATQLVYESIKNEKTVGVIAHDELSGITEIAQPLGPVFAVIPVTNPTSTTLFKILICLKTRNPIIISAHRGAAKCVKEAARICYEAALEAGAPEDCIQVIPSGSRDFSQLVMGHQGLALILATGGTGLVTAAYSSGNPAIGVGPGNVPVYIHESADIPFAVNSIITSKTFDNGTICASEQAIVVEEKIANQVMAEFELQHCHFLNAEETEKLGRIAILKETMTMSPFILGQSVEVIAKKAGIDVPEGTRILMAEPGGVGKDYPLSYEILAPILAFYRVKDHHAAFNQCIDLNYLGGIGHTAGIYANDDDIITQYSQLINAGRIVVNTPTSQGAVGGTYNLLTPSFTLGCGTGGKNITTENISVRHLINIQRLSRRRPNKRFADLDQKKYMDEQCDIAELLKDFHKNQ
jgi:acetaldehyde dehydrogenase/alcohol dehydrogenase